MDLTEKNLHAALEGREIGYPIHFYQLTESTNAVAFRLAVQGASEGTCVIADCQTAGKGRLHRLWQSPPGLNLYMSLVLRPHLYPSSAPTLSLMAGVAVAGTLKAYCPAGIHLKWPNDVYINERKICGILSEIKTIGKRIQFIILGIGVNINMTTEGMPDPLRNIATSLKEETGKDISRLEIVVKLLDSITDQYHSFLSEGFGVIRTRWRSFTQMIGQCYELSTGNTTYRGEILDIDERGALLIRREGNTIHQVLAGDVVIIKEQP